MVEAITADAIHLVRVWGSKSNLVYSRTTNHKLLELLENEKLCNCPYLYVQIVVTGNAGLLTIFLKVLQYQYNTFSKNILQYFCQYFF